MFAVYVLRSLKTGRRYVGSCQDVEARIQQHNSGHTQSTRHGKPWVLIHHELLTTRVEAVRRELYLKSGQGREWLDGLGV